jgi:hypothetical protein
VVEGEGAPFILDVRAETTGSVLSRPAFAPANSYRSPPISARQSPVFLLLSISPRVGMFNREYKSIS